MAVKLRLSRGGSKKHPMYRVVAADSRYARDGRFIESLGQYDPNQAPAYFSVKRDRVDYWLSQGAKPSETLKNLLSSAPASDASHS